MPAARYWRISAIETLKGGDLALSECALYETGVRVDASAQVLSTLPPASGTLSALQDASFASTVRWAAQDVALPGFSVVWDFGPDVSKDISKVGVAGPEVDAFTHRFALSYSADGDLWTQLYATPKASLYPGTSAFYELDATTSGDAYQGFFSLAANTQEVLTPYAKVGGVFTKLPTPSWASVSTSAAACSPDGTVVVLGHTGTYSSILARSGQRLVGAGAIAQGSYTNGIAFNPSGDTIAVAHRASPFVSMFLRSGDAFNKLADPAVLPSGEATGVSFSPDGVYLAVAHYVAPFLTIYKRTGNTFAKLADPAQLPAGSAHGVAFSPDGVYLAVAHEVTPFITVYRRTGDSFAKLATPAALAGSFGTGVAFSPDGSHLAVSSTGAPRITVYSRSGDTFTKLASPSTTPTGECSFAAYSPDGAHLVCGQYGASTPSIYSRSGGTYTLLQAAEASVGGAVVACAFLPFTSDSVGMVDGGFDPTPLRTPALSSAALLSDAVGATQSLLNGEPLGIDVEDGGDGRITGTVKRKDTPLNVPLRRRVVLLNNFDHRKVREVWSDAATGYYEFTGVARLRTYTVVSYDHTGQYRAVLADNLTPERMS